MTGTPLMPSKNPGTVAELRTQKRLGGRLTPASGALVGAKGDLDIGQRLKVENKTTVGKSLSLKAEWMCKIAQEAVEADRVPALAIQFVYPDGRPRFHPWVCIPEWLFKEMMEAYEDANKNTV